MLRPFLWLLPAALVVAAPLASSAEEAPASAPAAPAVPTPVPPVPPTPTVPDAAAPAAPAAPAPAPGAVKPTGPSFADTALAILSRIELGGLVSASYTYNFNRPESGLNVGRGYDASANQPMLNKALLKLALPVAYDPEAWQAGFTFKLLFGQDARFTQVGLAIGDFGDLFEATATVNVPLGRGLKITAGKYPTPIGYESAFLEEAPNWSGGLAWTFVEPFNHLGVGLRYAFSESFEAELLVNSGWDVVADNNHSGSGILHLAFTPMATTSLHLSAFAGPEQASNDRNWRFGGNLYGEHRWSEIFRTALQLDYGGEQFQDAAGNDFLAQWFAAGLWLVMQPSPLWGLALRADFLRDTHGVRTSEAPKLAPFGVHGSLNLFSTTLTFNFTPVKGLRIAPELRWDWATLPTAFEGKQSQLTLALGAAYLF
ncbi:MAG TPA: outer membrane beta-barrel protein [Myxococcales bacterium]|jgi:hypothetical protein